MSVSRFRNLDVKGELTTRLDLFHSLRDTVCDLNPQNKSRLQGI